MKFLSSEPEDLPEPQNDTHLSYPSFALALSRQDLQDFARLGARTRHLEARGTSYVGLVTGLSGLVMGVVRDTITWMIS